MNLIAEFERFKASSVRRNPSRGESETTAFMQHLSEEGILQDFTDVDWLKLAERLEMTDDQYAAMFEGTASWILPESLSVARQEPADWPDELPQQGARTIKTMANPAPATRGISSKSARRGTPEFEDLMDEVEDDWELDEEELENIVEVRRAGDSFEIRMKGETEWELLEEEGDDNDEVSEGEESDLGPDEDFGGEEE